MALRLNYKSQRQGALARFLRPGFITALMLALAIFTTAASAADPRINVVEWEDLLPANLYSFISEDGITNEQWSDPAFQARLKESETKTRPELEQADAVLAGYMVPLEFEADIVKMFLLVPSAGMCIHVPPPPPNQTVLVRSEKGVKIRTYDVPIIVAGKISVQRELTDYAETSYTILADEIVDFSFDEIETMTSELEARRAQN